MVDARSSRIVPTPDRPSPSSIELPYPYPSFQNVVNDLSVSVQG